MEPIHGRAVIQVVGKPKEHVEQMIETVIARLSEMGFDPKDVEHEPVEQLEGTEHLFSGFFEADLTFKTPEQVFSFVQQFQPISLEISEPEEFEMPLSRFNSLVSAVASAIQEYDTLLKEKIAENAFLNRKLDEVARNLIMVSMRKPKTPEELVSATGLPESIIRPYLQKLVEAKQAIVEDGAYRLA